MESAVDAQKPTRYLNRAEVAKRIGLKSVNSLSKMRLPPHDAIVGPYRGWLPSTVDRWNENRPGRGWWGSRGRGVS